MSGDSSVQFDDSAYTGGYSITVAQDFRYIKLSIIGNGDTAQWIGVQEVQVFGSEVVESSGASSSAQSPSTGDINNQIMLIALLALAAVTVSILSMAQKSNKSTK